MAVPWIRAAPYSLGITDIAAAGFPTIAAWVERFEQRPATKEALEGDMINTLRAKDGWEEDIKKKSAWVTEQKEGTRKRDEL